jgi:hypothetical protein
MKPHRTIQEMGIPELETLRATINAELAALATDRRNKVTRLQSVEAEISARRKKPEVEPGVTDHALLRYMERVMGFDVEGLRQKIMTPQLASAIKSGVARYHADGVEMVIRDHVVVTLAA